MNRLCPVVIFGALIATASVATQQPTAVEFEVVSVKPADRDSVARLVQTSPDGFRGRNLRLFELVMNAWHLNTEQLIGGPNWQRTLGWDIDAKFPSGATSKQLPEMMQGMLADRFRLAVHWETRTLAVYELRVAKNGLKLQPEDGAHGMSAGPRLIRMGSATMAELASQLSGFLGRNVTDQTGVAGKYKIDLSFAPVELKTEANAAAESAPSIFRALEEQAGLKLVSTKGPVQVLVVDHADMPSAN